MAVGRGAQDEALREALRRIDGAPVPDLDPMQIAMGAEGQIRAAFEVIREYLDARGMHNTSDWAARSEKRAPAPPKANA